MITDWQNTELCTEWLKEMGEYGDLPRQAFSLPIALGLAKTLSAKKPIQSGLMRESVLELADTVVFNKKPYDSHTISGINCLDLGCGDGFLGRYLNNFGVKYLGLDGSPNLVRFANKNNNSKLLKFETADLDLFYNDPDKDQATSIIKKYFDSEKIDIIFCHSIIEHLKNFKQFFLNLSTWAHNNSSEVIISLFCLNEEFITNMSSNIKKRNYRNSSFSHSIEVPCTNSFVWINFFSETKIKKIIDLAHYTIVDKLIFNQSLYSNSVNSLLDAKFKNWENGGPFNAYFIAPKKH